MEVCVQPSLYDMRSSRQSGSFSLLIGIIVVAGIVVGMVCVGDIAMEQIAKNVNNDAMITANLQGNDVVVTVLDDSSGKKITSIEISIEGIPGRSVTKPVTIGSPIYCKNLASGITGSNFIVITAVFSDGTSKIIHYARVQFS